MDGDPVPGATTGGDPVALPAEFLDRYRMVSLYNSPYAAHDRGRAVDLYPDPGTAPSPVAGRVRDVRSVEAPPKPYAEPEDHLILVDVDPGDPVVDGWGGRADPEPAGDAATDRGLVARVLHVDPGVDPGQRVRRGDSLGRTIRSGFFAPWVDDHLHVGFRPADANLYRASGSLPVRVDAAVEPLDWDGRGTVVEAGDTYAVLDRPAHPAPGDRLAGIAADRGTGSDGGGVTDDGGRVLDGGLPHYEGGGLLPAPADPPGIGPDPADPSGIGPAPDPSGIGRSPDPPGSVPEAAGDRGATVSLLGTPVGTVEGRHVDWDDPTVLVDGDPVHGLSLYAGRDRAGAKLVCPDRSLAVGDAVRVSIDGSR